LPHARFDQEQEQRSVDRHAPREAAVHGWRGGPDDAHKHQRVAQRIDQRQQRENASPKNLSPALMCSQSWARSLDSRRTVVDPEPRLNHQRLFRISNSFRTA